MNADSVFMSRYNLAVMLHKTVAEIDEMTMEEFRGWIAYSRIHNNG